MKAFIISNSFDIDDIAVIKHHQEKEKMYHSIKQSIADYYCSSIENIQFETFELEPNTIKSFDAIILENGEKQKHRFILQPTIIY